MNQQKVTYRFNYHQLITDDSMDILDLFKNDNLPESKTEHGYVKLSSIKRSDKYLTGIMGLVLTQNLPVVINFKNNTKAPLKLAIDEGVMYGTAFLYDIKEKVLVYQNSRPGVSATGFLSYLSENNKVPVDTILVLDQKLMKKGYLGRPIKYIEMKLSNAGSTLFSQEMTAKELTASADQIGAAYLTIKYSAPRGKYLLNVIVDKWLKTLLKDYGNYTSQVESLKIKCDDIDGKDLLIDLIKHKMTFDLDYFQGRDNIAVDEENFLPLVITKYEEELPRLLQNLKLQKV